jgi:calcium-dependent protein kinase
MAFDMFDLDGNGIITLDEIKEVLGAACDVDDKVWKKVIKEVDDNNDGVIQFDEFS